MVKEHTVRRRDTHGLDTVTIEVKRQWIDAGYRLWCAPAKGGTEEVGKFGVEGTKRAGKTAEEVAQIGHIWIKLTGHPPRNNISQGKHSLRTSQPHGSCGKARTIIIRAKKSWYHLIISSVSLIRVITNLLCIVFNYRKWWGGVADAIVGIGIIGTHKTRSHDGIFFRVISIAFYTTFWEIN